MSTRRALAFSYLDRYASLVIALLASVVIARLLTPAQFGIFSLTAVVVTFVAPFRDLGASQYLINERELTTERIKAVWALQLSLGAAIAVTLYFGRHFIAHAYKSDDIAPIMAVLALNSLVMPFGSLTGAWLTREMRFDQLALVRFSGALSGAVASVLFAWLGHGAISLAYGSLFSSLASAVVGVYYRPTHFPWAPGFNGIREVLGFGSSISITTLFRLLERAAPELAAGRLLGTLQSGYLARAQGFVALFERLVTDSIGAVALPAFSRLNHNASDMGAPWLRGLSLLIGVGWPLLGFMAVMSRPLIDLLYGHQWGASVEVAQVLCLSSMCLLTTTLGPAVLIAAGKHWLMTRVQAFNAVQLGILAIVGAQFDIRVLSFFILLGALISSVVWLSVLKVQLNLQAGAIVRCLVQGLTVAGTACMLPALIHVSWPQANSSSVALAELAIAALSGLIAFTLTIRAQNHPAWTELKPLWQRVRLSLRSRG